MTRKREPQVYEVAEGGFVVRHTHDLDLARRLLNEYLGDDDARAAWAGVEPRTAWMRVAPCLPGSYGEAEGWAYQYHYGEPGTRGSFRAVEFWR